MKNRFLPALFGAALVAACGCSSEPPKASTQEVKQFGGGPPPADYMDAANKATKNARDKNAPPASTP